MCYDDRSDPFQRIRIQDEEVLPEVRAMELFSALLAKSRENIT